MNVSIRVHAQDIQDEWDRMPGATPCEVPEPEPRIPEFPFCCSRPYDHLGPHAATVPDDELGVELIAAVWT